MQRKSLPMESKVAKFEMSPSFTASVLPHNGVPERTYKASRPISTLIRKRLSQLEALPSQQQKNRINEEHDQFNTAVNLCPDGSEISISANGTTLTATKTSLNVTIGKFTICIKSCDDHTLIKEDNPIPSAVALVSIAKGTPLHVILEDGVLHVTAARSFSELNCLKFYAQQLIIVSFLYVQLKCFLIQTLNLLTQALMDKESIT